MSDSLRPCESQHTRPSCHHQLLEFTQTHVHWVVDAIQPSHPLSSPSPPALNLSQHQFSSVQSLSHAQLFENHESQHARPPCPSPSPGVHSDSRPLSQWCHPGISSSVIPFSSCSQSLPASESFPISQLFAWGGQSTGVSASASLPPKKSQGWSPSEWTGWISVYSWTINTVFLKNQSVNLWFLIEIFNMLTFNANISKVGFMFASLLFIFLCLLSFLSVSPLLFCYVLDIFQYTIWTP